MTPHDRNVRRFTRWLLYGAMVVAWLLWQVGVAKEGF